MSTKKKDLWHADPHTLAKIAILKYYLNAWFAIVGKRFDGPVLYIDGFAGPGYYTNSEEGSPVAALNVINSIYIRDNVTIKADCNIVLIEKEIELFKKLEQKIGERKWHPRIKIRLENKSFADAMAEIMQLPVFSKSFQTSQPLLIFADPFGATGVPFNLIKKFFESGTTELLLNFDADGVERIRKAKNTNWEHQLDDIFGDSSWRESIPDAASLTVGATQCLKLFERKLKEIKKLDYVWSFEMRGKNDRINYYLLFATTNIHGMKKMKEAMRSLNKSGEFIFSDAYHNQLDLFSPNSELSYENILHQYFIGQTVDMFSIEKYVLCQTPYTSCKTLLKNLSEKALVIRTPSQGSKLVGHTFPDGKIEAVTFINQQERIEQLPLF